MYKLINFLNFFYVIVILIIIHFVLTKFEGVDNTMPGTVVGVENAYTNIHCINENLPIIKIGTKLDRVSCLSKTANENDCYKYSDFSVPSGYQCTNSSKDLNNYLSKDGLRDKSTKARSLFDNLMSSGYYNHTCNDASIKDASHWCGKIYNAIQARCAAKNKFERASDRLCNEEIYKSPPANKSSTFFSKDSISSKINMCKNKNCARSVPPGMTKAQCLENCDLCYETKCN